jgi:hypothetical protein
MDQGGWYIGRADTQSGPHQSATLQKALISGQVVPSDQIWREGMDGWETAKVFLWFAKQGQAGQQAPSGNQAAAPAPAPAAAEAAPAQPAAEAQQRPAPTPPGADGALGKLEQPEKKVLGKVFGRLIAISEGDLADFAGDNAEPFLAFRQKMIGKGRMPRLSWSWSAFFMPLAWFAYRRQTGAVYAIVTIAALLGLVCISASGAGPVAALVAFVVSLVSAMTAKPLLLVKADRAAALADELDLHAVKRAVLMASQGGKSKMGAWIGGILHVALYVYAVYWLMGSYVAGFARGWS